MELAPRWVGGWSAPGARAKSEKLDLLFVYLHYFDILWFQIISLRCIMMLHHDDAS